MDNEDSSFLAIPEMIERARAALPAETWNHVAGGAGTEFGVMRNRWALDSLAIRPRVLRDVVDIDLSASLLGHTMSMPVILAPIGSLHRLRPEAEVEAIRAANAAGIAAFVSSLARTGIEELARHNQGLSFFQLYIKGRDAQIDDILERVKACGYGALAVTVDSPYYGIRDRQLLDRWNAPPTAGGEARVFQASVTWRTIARIKARLGGLPLMLKGIQTGEDARIAVEEGVDAIYVSNHGGRQLDHCRGTMDILPEVADAAGGAAQIVIDGGFTRGTDIFKALALGADAVSLGRLYAYALACGGAGGVVRLLGILEEELRNVFGLAGVVRREALTPDYVVRADIHGAGFRETARDWSDGS